MSESKTVRVANATKAELEKYAPVLGLDLKDGEHHNALRARISAALAGAEEFTIPAGEELAPGGTTAPAQREQLPGTGQRKINILINKTEEAGGDRPVPVSVNGSAMFIPRGEIVAVPAPYVEALRNAVRHVYDVDKEGMIVEPPREVQSYPFREIGDAA